MRTFRAPVFLFLFLAIFAANGSLWAGETKQYYTPKGMFEVELDDNQRIVRGVMPDGKEMAPRDISGLGFQEKGGKKFFEILNVSPGAVVYTKPGGTCVWVFDGRSYVYYCY